MVFGTATESKQELKQMGWTRCSSLQPVDLEVRISVGLGPTSDNTLLFFVIPKAFFALFFWPSQL